MPSVYFVHFSGCREIIGVEPVKGWSEMLSFVLWKARTYSWVQIIYAD